MCRASVLALPLRALDPQLDVEALRPAARAAAANRRGAEVVEADRDPDIRRRGADAVRRVEADPAEVTRFGFGPGVACVLLDNAVGAAEIACDIAGRNAQRPRGRDEDVRQILAYAA